MTPEVLLDRIEALAKIAPFTAAAVEGVIGASLFVTSDSDYFALHEATSAPGFTKVTVMEAKPGATNGGSVALALTGSPCVTAETAAPRFGIGHRVPTHPGAPTRKLEVWTHTQPWGDLLLAYDPATGCLAEATLRAR